MYRVDRNNFYRNEKKATIFTPDFVSEFLYDLLHSHINLDTGVIIDPCVGQGSLLKPWKRRGYAVMGIDIEHQGFPNTKVKNYLEVRKDEIKENISLVIRTLGSAFAKPVTGTDLVAASVAKLEAFQRDMDKAYGACADGRYAMKVGGEGTLTEAIAMATKW